MGWGVQLAISFIFGSFRQQPIFSVANKKLNILCSQSESEAVYMCLPVVYGRPVCLLGIGYFNDRLLRPMTEIDLRPKRRPLSSLYALNLSFVAEITCNDMYTC